MASCANLSSSSGFKQEINTRTVLRKTNFHLSPVYNKEVAGLFIIKGDTFTSYLKSDNFLFGNYKAVDGGISSGWISGIDLEKLSNEQKANENISSNDFKFFTSYKEITLGDYYPEFYNYWGKCEINKQPDIGITGNFEEINGINYKYFDHYWDGLYIKTSNINREQLKNDFDWYHITEINVLNDKYMTNHGIYVGMKENEIVNAYGDCHKKNSNSCSYSYKNNKLTFNISNGVITSIDMEELPL